MMATNRGIYLRLPPGLRERVYRAAAEEAARRGRPLTVQQWIREVLQSKLQTEDDAMRTFTILWGHSGTQGRHWTTAREASRYAAEEWGTVEASSPEAAIEIVRAESPEGTVGDWYADGDVIHIVPVSDWAREALEERLERETGARSRGREPAGRRARGLDRDQAVAG